MRRKHKKIRPRGKIRDNSKSISVRMTEEQFQRLTRYLELTHLPVTTYFRKLIAENSSREKPPPVNRRLYAETNMICSNLQQILRNPAAVKLDKDAVKQIQFLRERMLDQIFCVQNLLDMNCKDEWYPPAVGPVPPCAVFFRHHWHPSFPPMCKNARVGRETPPVPL